MRKLSIPFLLASLLLLTDCSTENTPIYTLSTNVNPSEAGSVNPSSGEFDEGTEVELTVTPNEHWVFNGWQGDHSGNRNPASIVMDSDKSITAQFIKREYPLTINVEGEGSVQEEVIQQKTTDYPHGTIVQLTANPAEGWEFIEWSGNIEGNENPKTITINEDISVTAVFEIQSFSITVQVEGEGSVILNPDKEEYEQGEEIEVTAEAEEGWIFSHWEGDTTGNKNPINITVDDNKNITAIFEEAPNTMAISLPQQGNVTILQANNAPSGVVFVSTEEVAFDDGNDGIWRSSDDGQSWDKTAEINVNFITIAANEPDLVFAGHDDGYLISQDGGQTWDVGSIDNTLSGDPLSLNNAAIITATDGIYVVTSDALGFGLYKSTNLGQSWQHILSSDDVSDTFDALLQHVEISPENSNVIYTSTSFDHNIWKSTNGGSTFSSIKSGITISPFVFADGIVVNPDNSQELLIQGHNSSDGGSTWNQQDVSPLSNIWIDNILIKVENNRIFGSHDLGDSWTEIVQLVGDNLPSINNPVLFLSEDGLFIKSNNDVYKTDLSVIKSNL
ncbi:InlB B-repeat-containing protein [Rhodohalobacter sp. 614A]|uniref:InlB B-repeat-containing protein n=1 Tax=Rhodohalobacter sp. 614A TaxID=2908649 RepID=UPI001F2F014D|nr:hypothetical protein [Rhodohalobacter sp. 614A]